jgi:hypothetical protein
MNKTQSNKLSKWIDIMEPIMPDLSCFVSVEHQLCLHPSNQNFYRFNSDYTDSDKMMHTIINFLNDEKLHISKWDIKRTLNVTKDQWEACNVSKMLVFTSYAFITSLQWGFGIL